MPRKSGQTHIQYAVYIERLFQLYKKVHLTSKGAAKEISKKEGLSREYINNYRQLLTLSEKVQGYVSNKLLSFNVAKIILKADAQYRDYLADEHVIKGVGTKRITEIVTRLREGDKGGNTTAEFELNPDTQRLINEYEERLGVLIVLSDLQKKSVFKVRDWDFSTIRVMISLHDYKNSKSILNAHISPPSTASKDGHYIELIGADGCQVSTLNEGLNLIGRYERFLNRE